jgi:hypothetical protein
MSFQVDGENPTVTVRAEYSKRRREDTLPLRQSLATVLRAFLAMRLPGALAFPTMPERQHVADMFRPDLEVAGVVYRDDAGRVVDFHALRHTFISNLARGGVHPKVAQTLARHSTITLTMDRYSHTLVGEQADALAALPDLSAPSRQAVRATGTNGPETALPVLASCLALSERFSETQGNSMGRIAIAGGSESSGRKSLENSNKNW